MHFNAALVVLASSALAAPSPATVPGADSIIGTAARAPAIVPNDAATVLGAREVVVRHIAEAVKLEARADSNPASLSSLASAANISLPTDVLNKADSLSSTVPNLAPTIIGIIINLREAIPLLKNTPLNVVVNLALPIIESVLNLLSLKDLSVRSTVPATAGQERDIISGLLNTIISTVNSLVTGLLKGVLSSSGGLTGLTGGLTGSTGGAGDLLGSVTSAIGSGGLTSSLGSLTGGLGAASTASANNSATLDSILSGVTGSLTSATGSQAASLLSGLPGLSGISGLTDITNSSQVANELGSLDPAALSSAALDTLANVLDFIVSSLSSVALLPSSLLPAPANAPFLALSGELDELKPVIESLKEIISSGLNLTDASTVDKLSGVLTDLETGLNKLADSIIPQILKPVVKYGLSGIVGVAQTVIYLVAGYVTLLLQSVKDLSGSGGSGLTDTLNIVGST